MNFVLITGGSRGIGAATALACARRGFGVVLTYHQNPAAAQVVLDRITAEGGTALALPLDVGYAGGFTAFRDTLARALAGADGHLTGLVNNAGHGLYETIDRVSEDQFDRMVDVHLKGPFFLTQALLPLLQPGASIVNLTSATTRVATAGVAPYAACKGALEVLTRYMAKEFGERRLRVNAVSPGAIRTELGGGLPLEFEILLASQTALGRVGEPDDVARVITSLLTDETGWVNAQSIEVGGGYVI